MDERLRRLRREAHPSYVSICPRCGRKSLWHNTRENKYECLNLECKAVGKTPEGIRQYSYAGKDKTGIRKPLGNKIDNRLLALLLTFSLSIVGLGISLFIGSSIPFWMLFSFSIILLTEKWFRNIVRNRIIGRLYRLVLNLGILSVFGLLVWSGIRLFSHRIVFSPLVGSIMFISILTFFIYLWRVTAKNSWRWPSMKLTTFSLIGLFVVFAFAGVQPMGLYKDKSFSYIGSIFESSPSPVSTPPPAAPVVVPTPKVVVPTSTPTVPTPTPTPVKPTTQPNLRNPSWEELKAFLWNDKTDEMTYVFPTTVCEDFAKTLQSNAKNAGLRCAFVGVRLNGYLDWMHYGIPSNTGHALNAFETTDRGLIYIDCTGLPAKIPGPRNKDTIIDIRVGGNYIPRSIFPDMLGYYWENMGTIVGIETVQW